jgi:twinkle protein
VQETGICLFAVSHLKRPEGKGHEEGTATSLSQLRGSGSIGQLSDIVIGLERNGQHEDERERHTTHVRILKNRFSGLTGKACSLLYSLHTGRMNETFAEKEL